MKFQRRAKAALLKLSQSAVETQKGGGWKCLRDASVRLGLAQSDQWNSDSTLPVAHAKSVDDEMVGEKEPVESFGCRAWGRLVVFDVELAQRQPAVTALQQGDGVCAAPRG
jgi:hypothetical protein